MENDTTTESTQVSTPETTTATPAIAETPQVPTTSERPSSMLESFKMVAAREERAAAPLDTATTQPAAPTDTTGAKGAPPQEKWPTILDNARTKGAAEGAAKVEAELGWVRSIPRETLEQTTGFVQQLNTDPVAFYLKLGDELASNPAHAAQLRSHAGRTLGSRQASPVELSPDLQVVDANGNVGAQAFSSERTQALIAQAVSQVRAEIGKDVEPIRQYHERQQADAAAAAMTAELNAQVDAIIADMEKLEGFEELKPAIGQALKENKDWSPDKAYNAVYARDFRPKLDLKAEQAAIRKFNKKAAGNTVNGAGVTATPGKLRTHEDLRRFLESSARQG